ncbi:polyisoprenyl-teichoic acid--peptidoglycan teichoic acid transferase TagU [Gottfriedia luciferensis]|uniref:polyisoprenyl-teichoic acid--peptidoglycan teichoic acid transferase TagU n=1 Tax=Gottfriedia luciferensis TaxID=178774 RepID=UPI000B44F39E|nr:LytR family transcriptional regulator [Gottfriedia luciferensis]
MSKTKKIIITLSIIIGVIILGIGVYAYSIYSNINKATESIHKDINKSSLRQGETDINKKQPFSILLLGVDHRPGDVGRSDSLILMTVNPAQGSTKMVSIPRDTRTEIVGKGKLDKINHAYAFGGIQMSVNTVEKFLNVPIDYFVEVNMEGFHDIVDAVNGVDVVNDLDFTYEGTHFKKGPLHLNGDLALKYTRMRKQDPRGDFGRQQRQRQVIEAVLKKGTSISSLTKYNDLLMAISKNIKTNISLNEMVTIQKNYRDATSTIDQMQMTGKGTMINKIYYFQVADTDRLKISNELRQHLELK